MARKEEKEKKVGFYTRRLDLQTDMRGSRINDFRKHYCGAKILFITCYRFIHKMSCLMNVSFLEDDDYYMDDDYQEEEDYDDDYDDGRKKGKKRNACLWR